MKWANIIQYLKLSFGVVSRIAKFQLEILNILLHIIIIHLNKNETNTNIYSYTLYY